MRVAIPDSVLRAVEPHFEPATFARGVVYASDGRVNLVRAEWPVVARVRGTDGYVVTVHYTRANRHMHGDCSCPVGVDCKHAVAAALVALTEARDDAEAWRAARKQEAVGEWLASIELARARAAPEPQSRNIVAYVLDSDAGAFGLSVHRSSELRRGGFGRSSVLGSLGDPSRGAPAWVGVEDLRRIALLRAVTRAQPYETWLPVERVDAALWRDLAASEHLFWERVEGQPLRLGPPRTASLQWREVEGAPGEHQIGIDTDGLLLVPSAECHYLDLEAREIGPLDVGAPANVVQQLASAPPVPAEMLATVQRSLRPLVGDEAAAALLPDADDAHPPLRPHLAVTLERSGGGASVEVSAEAVYAEDRYPLAEWEPRRPAPRDLLEEGRLLRMAEELLEDYDGPQYGRASDLLSYARHVAHHVAPVLAARGWTVSIDEELPVEPLALPEAWVEELTPLSDSHGWFSLALGVVIGGRTVPLLPLLLHAIREGDLPLDAEALGSSALPGLHLRLPTNETVFVPGERLRRWLRPLVELQLRELDGGEALLVPDVTAVELADETPGRFSESAALAEARERVAALLSLEPRREPGGFGTELRTYQRQGLAWLRYLHDCGYGGVLADDMGLGKTVQVLALLESLRGDGGLGPGAPALVVAPRSVVDHWRAEAERFSAGLEPLVHLGPGRAKAANELAGSPLVVTSYQTFLRDAKMLREIGWTTAIFDEAQALKNPSTRLRRAAASVRATSRFCITGTPVENHLGELWSQMDLVMPGLLGRKTTFEAAFRRPIERWGKTEQLELLRQRIRPFLLRRTKKSVDVELPDKIEIVEHVELGTGQRDLYESLRLSLDEDVRRALRDKGVNGSSLAILDALLKLRQVCCDPRLVKTPQAQEVKSSAKLERLMSLLEELADAGRSVLVFSQFTSMLQLIEAECRAAKIRYGKLTGATRKREEVVRAFQAGSFPVFLISLKAGGTGLHLTRADTVIHYDPWWNPAVEDQASDRAHRIGQEKKVVIYKLVARGTLEERIAAMQGEKRALTTAALARGGATHLAAGDLEALYRRIV